MVLEPPEFAILSCRRLRSPVRFDYKRHGNHSAIACVVLPERKCWPYGPNDLWLRVMGRWLAILELHLADLSLLAIWTSEGVKGLRRS